METASACLREISPYGHSALGRSPSPRGVGGVVTVTRLTSREGSAGGQGRTRRARLGAGPHLPRRAPAPSRRPVPRRSQPRSATSGSLAPVARARGRPLVFCLLPETPRERPTRTMRFASSGYKAGSLRLAQTPLSLAKKTSQLGHEPKGRRMDPGAQATPRPCDPLRPGGSGPGADPESVGPEPCRYLLQEKEQKRHSKVGAGRRQERRMGG